MNRTINMHISIVQINITIRIFSASMKKMVMTSPMVEMLAEPCYLDVVIVEGSI